MNYAEYLQQGGTAQPSIEEQVTQLVQAAMSGNQEAGQQIEQIMQAAEQGDPKAQQIAQLIQQITLKLQSEKPEAMKCGGKVRAKIKKACGGKKMEKGGEAQVKKEAKGGKPCPCTLRKVGGKLIEVDCEGNPIDKKDIGGVFFRNPFSSWMEFKRQFGYPVEWAYNKITNYNLPGNLNSNLLSEDQVQKIKNNSRAGVEKMSSTLEFPELSKPKIATGNTQLTLQPKLTTISKEAIIGEGPQNELPEVVVSAPKIYKGLFEEDLRSLQARQNWVKSNADYLKFLGWSDNDIANYKGLANLNLRLAKQISGLDEWKKSLPLFEGIYDEKTAKIPFAQVNPIVAAHKEGGKLNYANYLK